MDAYAVSGYVSQGRYAALADLGERGEGCFVALSRLRSIFE